MEQLESLDELRQRIDQIDTELLGLISARARCAQQVARVKLSDDANAVFYRPEREAQVLRRIMALNPGPLAAEEMARLFREVMSACLALERPIQVAYLGPEGTFTQQAALKHFGDSASTQPMPSIDDVFREVEAGAVNYGVVPVENSTEGVVNHTLDTFIGSALKICGEVVLRIHHHLMVGQNTQRQKISRIYSHPQSLAQCRKWLDAHYPMAERVAVSSNAEAARLVKTEWHSAAIAGDMAARRYGLEIIAEKIEDRPDNSTRFLIISTDDVPPCGNDKTSLVVAMRNQPGALHALIEPFQRHGIDMTRLETRPSRTGVWNYVFFIDLKGHREDPVVAAALEEVQLRAAELKVLGSYPVGVL
ncbi:prephenate dehydratase [Halotalea alkalilenta]|uniref:Bifunctional chorismate mutase/prephenate dehydratase n=1 Tax=Halotalea alkalilenta TaxID=376489 RepID=A0A172YK25_9GAMM|nr:prephenate dehydratase [Halotalea alkalilenta]